MNKKILKIFKNLLITLTFVLIPVLSAKAIVITTGSKNDMTTLTISILSIVLTACMTEGYLYSFLGSFSIVALIMLWFTYAETDFVMITSSMPFLLSLVVVAFTTSTMKQYMVDKEKISIESEKERMRGNLLRAISHDIRTPLTSIIGSSSAILEHEETLDKEKKVELVKSINDEATWLLRMVENLLTVTRITGEVGGLKTQNEIAEEILASAVTKFRSRFKTPTVSIQIPEDLLIVPMDPILIEQVLRNLMENVVKHSEGATKIVARLKGEDDFAVFEIEDDGSGIPEDKIKSGIFSGALSQGDIHKGDSSRNMGIGLSVCFSIVKAHKGIMEAENTDNGALFRFKLPLAKNKEDELNG